jgi:catechol 2,3-dioxygenase-like lactoylglutathione lyase family enzyme
MRLSLRASLLNVRNLDRSQEFYQNVFEFQPVAHGDLDETRIHDLTDVCRRLIDPDLSQRPTTSNAQSR